MSSFKSFKSKTFSGLKYAWEAPLNYWQVGYVVVSTVKDPLLGKREREKPKKLHQIIISLSW